jgi:hypothetical protein
MYVGVGIQKGQWYFTARDGKSKGFPLSVEERNNRGRANGREKDY